MPQLNISPTVEPLILEHQTVTINGVTVDTALFDARYDYRAKVFRGYALLNGKVEHADCTLTPQQAAIAVSTWIHGWITTAQRTKLFNLAKACPKDRAIIEVGSWKGKSTSILGWGSKAGNHACVWAIDPHEATPLYWIIHQMEPGSSWPQFSANIRAGGLDDIVFPLVMPSQQAAHLIREAIGVLFIDGDHHYAALDAALWGPRVVSGGWIALHDTNFTTVQAAISVLQESGRFGEAELIDSMAVLPCL